jgi:hypothetical protein
MAPDRQAGDDQHDSGEYDEPEREAREGQYA